MSRSPDDLIIKRVFKCPKRTLFDAWSTPSIMAKWFFASRDPFRESTVTNSFAVGGAYSVSMHMADTDAHLFGNYTEITRYSRIAFTFNSPAVTDSHIVLDFRDISPNRSELTLTQSLFPSDDVRNSHDRGWNVCFEYLDAWTLSNAQKNSLHD